MTDSPEWKLVKADETRAPIPGRPQFIERRVRKEYLAPLAVGIDGAYDGDPVRAAEAESVYTYSFECSCGGGPVVVSLVDGFEQGHTSCDRTYVVEFRIRRVDEADIPPPGMPR